jgi:hypothetical protein
MAFAATSVGMRFALFLIGGGRDLSADDWMVRPWRSRS